MPKQKKIKDTVQLENLIEKTLREAFDSGDVIADLKGENHNHSEVFREELNYSELEAKEKAKKAAKISEIELKSGEKSSLKIPGVRQEDGSDCCGGGCCEIKSEKEFEPELSKKAYLEIINLVLDPETGVGITDMGLIYDVVEHKDGLIEVTMTLTSMGCPAGGQITTEIDAMLRLQPHVTEVKIEVVWEPAWNPEMMNPDVKAMLFGN